MGAQMGQKSSFLPSPAPTLLTPPTSPIRAAKKVERKVIVKCLGNGSSLFIATWELLSIFKFNMLNRILMTWLIGSNESFEENACCSRLAAGPVWSICPITQLYSHDLRSQYSHLPMSSLSSLPFALEFCCCFRIPLLDLRWRVWVSEQRECCE